ncbi:MAG: thioredoxin-dependent thiol peroxidase [Sporocytophaga sp.]|uniref:thioredoxin-dependent thiol peroxidase n=1 Tax=Sporocytophaga sp. TaxID=2231183 RepID=UPI001B25CEDC|nr:thioredoxin-dependent thiol peroxidase [Sporocytophaga sp.]MBO9701897.1 thioredoxin-dependent thiol peroxidase [Sporocytophaga sp.]
MKGFIQSVFLTLFLLSCSRPTKLKVGDVAPDFTSKDQDGKIVTLSSFKGKKVILYFYPKDNTPGCTKEACNFRDNYELLQKDGYTVLGVSSDDEASHRIFKNQFRLPFTLIADVDKSIHEKYGTWVEKERGGEKFMGTSRVTFIIDENGLISEIIDEVIPSAHTEQIRKEF